MEYALLVFSRQDHRLLIPSTAAYSMLQNTESVKCTYHVFGQRGHGIHPLEWKYIEGAKCRSGMGEKVKSCRKFDGVVAFHRSSTSAFFLHLILPVIAIFTAMLWS